ncbi:class I SAM-dependent methyltransferase [Flagellimonas sp. S174]|uniref:class I SAM-dependent methyltransferase n=1 Tax=Flagellimonas sp. S174 TaxID=3410790 RepID=UPI003BF56DEC
MKGFIEKIRGRSIPSLYRSFYAKVWDIYYDFKYNVDTDAHVLLENLDLSNEHKKHFYWYEGTKVRPLKKLFKHLDIPKDRRFIDIGSGKGRVLLVAAEYGFKKIIGIELSRSLYQISKKNIDTFKQKRNIDSQIEVLNINALDYVFKDDEDIIFLYNPFDEQTLKQLVFNIKSSKNRNNREIKIIYANSIHHKAIEENLNVFNIERMSIYNVGFTIYDV